MVLSSNYIITRSKSKKSVSTPDGMSSENEVSARSSIWPTNSLSRTSSCTNNSPGTIRLVLPSSDEKLEEVSLAQDCASSGKALHTGVASGHHPAQSSGSPHQSYPWPPLHYHSNSGDGTIRNPPPPPTPPAHQYYDPQYIPADPSRRESVSLFSNASQHWSVANMESHTFSDGNHGIMALPTAGLPNTGSALSIGDGSEDLGQRAELNSFSHPFYSSPPPSGVGGYLPVVGRTASNVGGVVRIVEDVNENVDDNGRVAEAHRYISLGSPHAPASTSTDAVVSVPATDQYRTSLNSSNPAAECSRSSSSPRGGAPIPEEEEEDDEEGEEVSWIEDQEEDQEDDEEQDEDDEEEELQEDEDEVLNSILLVGDEESNQMLQRCKRIGLGGDRGSSVYEVSKEKLQRNLSCKKTPQALGDSIFTHLKAGSYAYKVYSRPIPPHEVHFALHANPHSLTHDPECAKEVIYGFLHLLLPIAYVEISGEKRAMILPLFCCSLKYFLQNYIPIPFASKTTPVSCASAAITPVAQRSSTGDTVTVGEDWGESSRSFGAVLESGSSACASSSLLSDQRYMPVRSASVITAIAYQLLTAINVCNHHVSHSDHDRVGVEYQGFTHNDIHLDNLLLNAQGRLSLCDFELVSPLPRIQSSSGMAGGANAGLLTCSSSHSSPLPRSISSSCSARIPPYSRQSPEGLCAPNADVWAFGLVLINLLTGVDPLFSSRALRNDFGNGPILKRWNAHQNCVDWERNIKDHIHRLMSREGSNTMSMEEAQGILHLCSRCLVNAEGRQSATADELLQDDIFKEYRDRPFLDEQIVAKWIAEHPRGTSL